jgi:hypothetical protein
MSIEKRVKCDYSLLEQDIMKLRKQNVLNELAAGSFKNKK